MCSSSLSNLLTILLVRYLSPICFVFSVIIRAFSYIAFMYFRYVAEKNTVNEPLKNDQYLKKGTVFYNLLKQIGYRYGSNGIVQTVFKKKKRLNKGKD